MTKLISVIIPAFNAAHTIGRALHCFQCGFNGAKWRAGINYEIIVVDDGSTDSTAVVVKQHIQRDKNVRIISKMNTGVSDARNTGLAYARGKYAWFFDADDTLFEGSVEAIVKLLIENEPDILRFNSVTVDKNTKDIVDSFNNLSDYSSKSYISYYQYLTGGG